jgi:RNA polymerase sigma factor (sigma-70 family)
LTEPAIIKGCVDKKQDCQRLLFEKYAGKMMSLCLRYVNDQQQAKDLLQMGFIKVFDYIHQYKGEGSFEGWMRRVFVSVVTRSLAKKKLNFTDIDTVDNSASYEDPSVITKMSEEEIHRLILKLPDGYRTVFNLHAVEGYTHDEIASLLDIQPATSRSQLLKARKMLQAFISKNYKVILV